MEQPQKGNTTVIAVIVVVVAITAGIIGWILAKNSQAPAQQATTQPSTPVAQTQPTTAPTQPQVTQPAPTIPSNQNYIEVKELGFKIPVSPEMANQLVYTIIKGLPTLNDVIPTDKAKATQRASFSSKTLNSLNKKCEQGIVEIEKIPGNITDIPALAQDYKTNPTDYKQYNGYFLFLEKYAVTDVKYTCGGNLDLEKSVGQAVRDGFNNAVLITQ